MTDLAQHLFSKDDRAKTVRQRGAFHLIALIPLSLFLLLNLGFFVFPLKKSLYALHASLIACLVMLLE